MGVGRRGRGCEALAAAEDAAAAEFATGHCRSREENRAKTEAWEEAAEVRGLGGWVEGRRSLVQDAWCRVLVALLHCSIAGLDLGAQQSACTL